MTTALSGPKASRLGSAMLWAMNVCALGGFACGKVSEAAPGSAPAPVASARAEPHLAEAAGPAVDLPNYSARIEALGACRKDQPCNAQVTVLAKGDYHINDKYPYRFKLDEPPPGVGYPKPVVGKEDGTIEQHKLTLKVPFVPESAGVKNIAGTLSLSVCSAANCLMDKQALELTIKVE